MLKSKALRVAKAAYHFCLTGADKCGRVGCFTYEVDILIGDVYVFFEGTGPDDSVMFCFPIRKSWR